MGLYDHFTLVQQRTSLCVLNVVQLSTLNDPNIDTDVSFIDPTECPHAGIYQWTAYYTVPDNMISDPSLHYIPDFRITFSTDNGNRIGCTITGPIALRMIAAQKERDGLIAFGIALSIFVSIFGILLLCSQYRRMSKRTNGVTMNTNGLLQPQQQQQQRYKPRPSSVTGTATSPTWQQKLHHPYPNYHHNQNNSNSNRSRSSTISSGQYIRTLPNGQLSPGAVSGPPSHITGPNHLPPPHPQQRRFQQMQPHHSSRRSGNSHPHRMTLSTSVEEGEEEENDDDEEYDDNDYINTDTENDDDDDNDQDDDAAVSGHHPHHHRRSRYYNHRMTSSSQDGPSPPPSVRSNPKYNETQLPSRPII